MLRDTTSWSLMLTGRTNGRVTISDEHGLRKSMLEQIVGRKVGSNMSLISQNYYISGR